jgi:hypothetical protein
LSVLQLCGVACCGECSKNTQYLKNSRSGQPKRVCEWCHYLERYWTSGTAPNNPNDYADDFEADEGFALVPHVINQPRVRRDDACLTVNQATFVGDFNIIMFFHYWPHPIEKSKGSGKESSTDRFVPCIRADSIGSFAQKKWAVRGSADLAPLGTGCKLVGGVHKKSGRVTLRTSANGWLLRFEGWLSPSGVFVGAFGPDLPGPLGAPTRRPTEKPTAGSSSSSGDASGEASASEPAAPSRAASADHQYMGHFFMTTTGKGASVDVSVADATEAELKGQAYDEGLDAEPEEEEGGPASLSEAMAGMRMGGATPSASASATASVVKEMTRVPKEEAVEALKEVKFSGPWDIDLTFTVVDLKADSSSAGVADFAARGRGRGRGRGGGGGAKGKARRSTQGPLKAGSVMSVRVDLAPKGASYFRGSCESMGQFGRDGQVTGSLQRTNGKVTMQIQVKSSGLTTSFSFIGAVNKEGKFIGTFSGSEIAKEAGGVSGTFEAYPAIDDEEDAEEDGGDAALAEGD